jgi:hypothetical protein
MPISRHAALYERVDEFNRRTLASATQLSEVGRDAAIDGLCRARRRPTPALSASFLKRPSQPLLHRFSRFQP